jgi:sugar phosphate isomerase/epimerase
MYLGAYDACLFDKSLGETLDIIKDLGLTSVEINSGGFLPPVHLPIEELRSSSDARDAYLGEFSSRGLTLTALNCNGNPLHPAEGFPHSADVLTSIEVAALLGVKRVVTMSGAPGGEPGTKVPVWNPLPWWSPFLDVQDHQWAVAVPYWKDIQQRAADADVRIAIEMHPGNLADRRGKGDLTAGCASASAAHPRLRIPARRRARARLLPSRPQRPQVEVVYNPLPDFPIAGYRWSVDADEIVSI